MSLIDAKTFPEKLLYCVKRVEARDDKNNILWTGTGYLTSIPDKNNPDAMYPVLITNKHVVEGVNRITISMHRAKAGSTKGNVMLYDVINVIIDPLDKCLYMHPNADIDLCGIAIGHVYHSWDKDKKDVLVNFFIPPSLMATDQLLKEIDIGDPVTMIGCPNGIWDEKNRYPIYRRGIIASHPEVDFEGRKEFVVDIGSFPGSSGSPVFLMDKGMIERSKGSMDFGPATRYALLGTLWGGPTINAEGEIITEPAPLGKGKTITNFMMHLGYVIKASETLKILDIIKADKKI